MSLSDIILQKIQDEINNDPVGLGYAGKTDGELMSLLNVPYTLPITKFETFPARINQILIGIAKTPNVIDEKDISDSKIFIPKEV